MSYKNRILLKEEFLFELAMETGHIIMDHPDCEIYISGEMFSYILPVIRMVNTLKGESSAGNNKYKYQHGEFPCCII